MGIPVLIMGESGSGKSASMRNFTAGEVSVFNVAGKPLPFRNRLPKLDNASYKAIFGVLGKPNKKCYVIDDSQYLMAFEQLDRAKESGYTKFTEMALHFSELVRFIINQTPPDCIVFFLHHTEEGDNGKTKAKTVGKMIDSLLTLEGLFSIVLLCKRTQDGYKFITQSDGFTTAKSPMEMFAEQIDNDLKAVDDAIRKYYEFKEEQNEED